MLFLLNEYQNPIQKPPADQWSLVLWEIKYQEGEANIHCVIPKSLRAIERERREGETEKRGGGGRKQEGERGERERVKEEKNGPTSNHTNNQYLIMARRHISPCAKENKPRRRISPRAKENKPSAM